MREQIIQGNSAKDKAEAKERKKVWDARDKDFANTPMVMQDVERILRGLVSPEAFADAKRARGEPMP